MHIKFRVLTHSLMEIISLAIFLRGRQIVSRENHVTHRHLDQIDPHGLDITLYLTCVHCL